MPNLGCEPNKNSLSRSPNEDSAALSYSGFPAAARGEWQRIRMDCVVRWC